MGSESRWRLEPTSRTLQNLKPLTPMLACGTSGSERKLGFTQPWGASDGHRRGHAAVAAGGQGRGTDRSAAAAGIACLCAFVSLPGHSGAG